MRVELRAQRLKLRIARGRFTLTKPRARARHLHDRGVDHEPPSELPHRAVAEKATDPVGPDRVDETREYPSPHRTEEECATGMHRDRSPRQGGRPRSDSGAPDDEPEQHTGHHE